MPTFRTGICERVVSQADDIQHLEVRVGEERRPAVLYPRYCPLAQPGDRLVVNTTAVDLGLGSGGDDFVVWNLAHETHEAPSGGHIMKLRYTPTQTDVLAVESPESEHHGTLERAADLGGTPVVATSLHSQLLPVVVAVRARRPQARIVYVMTDGGALDVAYSRTVRRLRVLGWLRSTVSVGHAVGGDHEAVNLYSGLLAARVVEEADVIVVGMGPGVVGTGTPFGTTAVDQGLAVNAAGALGGRPIVAVRMSSSDPRDRHRGISHHALSVLSQVALLPAAVPLPRGHVSDIPSIHSVVEVDVSEIPAMLDDARAHGLEATHMGRGPDEDALFFLAAGAAGFHAASLLAD